MKISKLFHWLYGILMLLPCFAILVKCAYVAFNKNAYESYSGTSTQYVQKTLQTNEVNSFDDFIEGNVYKINNHDTNYNVAIDDVIPRLHIRNIIYVSYVTLDDNYVDEQSFNVSVIDFYNVDYQYSYDCDYYSLTFLYTFNDDDYFTYTLQLTNDYDNYFYFIYKNNTFSQNINALINIGFIEECPQEYLQYITYYEEVEISTLDNVFYYAVDEVCNNELFAWASNSFLNAPLTYITNLFNMPTDNAVILLMSYWFNISIIWLCFDVMVYVPLLVHRWLDKGIVE